MQTGPCKSCILRWVEAVRAAFRAVHSAGIPTWRATSSDSCSAGKFPNMKFQTDSADRERNWLQSSIRLGGRLEKPQLFIRKFTTPNGRRGCGLLFSLHSHILPSSEEENGLFGLQTHVSSIFQNDRQLSVIGT